MNRFNEYQLNEIDIISRGNPYKLDISQLENKKIAILGNTEIARMTAMSLIELAKSQLVNIKIFFEDGLLSVDDTDKVELIPDCGGMVGVLPTL